MDRIISPPASPLTDDVSGAPGAARQRQTLGVIRALWWLGVAVFVGLALWLLGPMLTPFAVAAAIGYFLDPVVSRLERRGVPRVIAASALLVSIMAVLVAALVVLVPLLAVEATALVRSVPGLYDDAQRTLARRLPDLNLSDGNGAVGRVFAQIGESLAETNITVFGGVVSGLNGLIRAILFWVVMPVVAFYLLMDWQRMLQSVNDLLPRGNVHTIQVLAREIDAALAGYVRGVALVCIILAIYYAALLGLVGLNYGLLVGVVAGVISFIPYVGALVGGVLAIGIALYQYSDAPLFISLVVGIFLVGQFLETQILVPRLLGSSVNLHPVWLIFAVMAFGYLFGLTGAIVAVPLAATMGVLVRFAVREYRQSPLYAGRTETLVR